MRKTAWTATERMDRDRLALYKLAMHPPLVAGRDLGGPSFGIKQAIDQGSILGPGSTRPARSSPRPAATATSACPTRSPRGIAGHLSYSEIVGAAVIADGEDEVLRGAREMLRRGASRLKLMVGGGVASNYDPLDVTQHRARDPGRRSAPPRTGAHT